MSDYFCADCIAAMSTWDWLWVTALCVVAALYGLYGSQRHLYRARLVEDMPTSKIRSAHQGYVELVGLVSEPPPPLPAPLTTIPCLWWNYRIERYQSSGKYSSWVTVHSKTCERLFSLDDGTGLCLVNPSGAEISAQHLNQWCGHTEYPTSSPGREKSFGGFSLSIGGPALGRQYRYTEQRIHAGDPLYVLGHFETDASGKRTLNCDQLAGDILSRWKQDFPALLAEYDADENGELNIWEWQEVRTAAQKTALGERQKLTTEAGGQNPEHSITKPVERGLPFIISSREQEHLSRRYRWSSFGFAVMFLSAGTMSTWLIGARFI